MQKSKQYNQYSQISWHSLSVDEVFQKLQCSEKGLSESEAEIRLKKYGFNQISSTSGTHPFKRFLLQFNNMLIYILLISATISAILAHWVDAGVIFGVVLINSLIGFIQEGKAEKALESIRSMLSPKALVLRSGHHTTIAAKNIVPGDVVILQGGDRVPADCRIIHSRNVRIDESILTGESSPAEKNNLPVSSSAVLGDRSSMVFSGTLVTFGRCTTMVVETGEETEIGKISQLLTNVKQLTTPLLRKVSEFSNWLSLSIIGISVLTFAIGYIFRKYDMIEMFMAAVSLAVAAIPEGLPAILTITMAIGVQRMAKRNAIVRRLPAVETLGSVTVICSDKTGTLTRNEMTVQTIITSDEQIVVTGTGYEPRGSFYFEGKEIFPEKNSPILSETLHAALLCNNSSVYQKNKLWILEGEPTEGALVAAALKYGLDPEKIKEEMPRTDEIPFESDYKFMATLNHDHEGNGYIFLKGAPEVILKKSTRQRSKFGNVELNYDYWKQAMETIGSKGQRLLALAIKETTQEHQELRFDDVAGDMVLVAVMGIIDPPREEAIKAVASCRSAGIRVKMITGDHKTTASAIASTMGIGVSGNIITGQEIENLDENSLTGIVSKTDVFARTSPEHKLRLVKALQKNGHVVAMTGDGVNDSPALKRADIGIAMGQKGTDAAKEASEMVLADDNFASIVHAVEEGRTVYDNLKKAILFILPTNGGEAFSVMLAIILGLQLPLTPVQVLWVNMVTAVTLALALAFGRSEPDIMIRPPRNPSQPLLTGFLVWRIIFVSMILVAGTMGHFIYLIVNGASISFARSASINTLVAGELVYLFNSRYIVNSSISKEGLFGSKAILNASGLLILFQGLFIYLPISQRLFGTVPIGMAEWARIAVFCVFLFFAVEAEKVIHHKFFPKITT